jgi:hypothetical protein
MSAERTVLDHARGPNDAVAADRIVHGMFLAKVATGLALLASLTLGPVLATPRFASAEEPPPGVAQQRYSHDFRGARFEPKYLRYCGPTPANFLKLEAEGLRQRYTGANVPPTHNPCGVEWRFHVRGNFVATVQYEILKCKPPSRGTFLAGGELYMKLDNPTSDAIAVSRGVYPDGSAAFDFKVLTDGASRKRIVRDFKRHHTTDKSLRGRLRLERDGPMVTASFAEGEVGPFTAFQRSEIGNADIRIVRFAGIAGGDAHAVLDMRILELQLEGEALALDGPFATPVPKSGIPKTKADNPKAMAATEANRLEGMQPVKEYYHSFKGDRGLPDDFTWDGMDPQACVRFEPEGVRITLPAGHPGRRMGTGLSSNFGIKGNFEITMSFEVLDEPEAAKAGEGTGGYLWIDSDTPALNRAFLFRSIQEQPAFGIWYQLRDQASGQGRTEESKQFPSKAMKGQLRLVRNGTTLSYYVAEDLSDKFTLLFEHPFCTEDIRAVRIGGQTGGTKASLDFRIADLRIRAQSFVNLPDPSGADQAKPAERGWLFAGLLVGGVLTGSLALASWLAARQRRRQRQGLAPAPSGEAPSRPDTAPAPLTFSCPDCGRKLKVGTELSGRKVRCPHCRQVVLVPSPNASPA